MKTVTKLSRWAVLFGALSLLSPMSAGAQNDRDAANVVLVPGDLVRVTVWERPEFSGEFMVNPEGSLSHPLYQEVQVAGVPLSEAKRRIRDFLARSYSKDPLLILEPLLRVAVGGEVRTPNLYSVPRGTSLAQVVALAGGTTEQANPSKVRIIRGGSRTITVDLTRPDPSGTVLKMASGDQVMVARRRNFFRDFIGPLASLTAAVASVVVVFRL